MKEQKIEKETDEPQGNIKDKLKEAVEEVRKETAGSDETATVIKVILISGAVVGVIWASKYALLALAGTIRAFKELRRSVKEK
jgi:F0F1-type ATP synthase assembly protein I